LDDESDEEGGRNKGEPKGNKKAKERIKIEADVADLVSKIDEFVKSKESRTLNTLEAKAMMIDKKNKMKQARWQEIRDFEEIKLALEEKKALNGLIAEVNMAMMMDPSTIDEFTKEW
jgi:hypothetical protein